MADANPGPSTPAGMSPEPTGFPDAQVAPRTHHLLMLEFGDRADFDNPRLEWRRLFSELLGTFALVLVAAGGGLLHAKGQIGLGAAVVAPGLMVLAIILFMGAISGAHLNPAVSLAFALRGDVGAIAALGVGGYIALDGLWAAPVSGVSMNPARSFGPALVSGHWASYWVYVVGPLAGALIAVAIASVLRGRGGDAIARAAGSGVLDEGSLAAQKKLSGEIDRGEVTPPGIEDTEG